MTKWLKQHIKTLGDNIALIDKDDKYTYSQLYDKIVELENGVLIDLSSDDVVSIIGDYSFNSLALLIALYEKNTIVVPISSSVQDEIKDRVEESFSSYIIYSDSLVLEKINIKESHSMFDSLRVLQHSGLILFSSGTTGKPKAMIQDLDNLIDSYKGKRIKNMNMLIFLMFDHIGGLNTVFNALSIGATLILPENRNADYICQLLEKYKIRVLPSSPTFLNLMLIGESYKKYDLKYLRMITYGTEAMPESLLKRLKGTFPKVKFLQTFGTSETGIANTSSKTSESTFMKIDDPNLKYKIVDNELWLKSKTQILGYLNAPMESFTDDGWFKTGDLVEVLDDEYLKIIGRSKEVINIGGEKVLPPEVESIILELDEIEDCMVYSEANPITGQMVVADLVTSKQLTAREGKKIIRKYCKGRLDNYKIPTKVNIVEKTNFGDRFKKIRRK